MTRSLARVTRDEVVVVDWSFLVRVWRRTIFQPGTYLVTTPDIPNASMPGFMLVASLECLAPGDLVIIIHTPSCPSIRSTVQNLVRE